MFQGIWTRMEMRRYRQIVLIDTINSSCVYCRWYSFASLEAKVAARMENKEVDARCLCDKWDRNYLKPTGSAYEQCKYMRYGYMARWRRDQLEGKNEIRR
jgi:hypothetical protein